MRVEWLVGMIVGAFAVGCSSSSSSPSAGSDASADTTAELGDGGCLNPVEGESCTGNEDVCPSNVSACCLGYVWSCDATSHTWVKLGLGCSCQPDDTGVSNQDTAAGDAETAGDAGPFACGPTLTCSPGQYCADQQPGIALPDGAAGDSYRCIDLPPACAGAPTCDCVEGHLESSCTASGCTDDAGHVTVVCMGV